MKKLLLLLLLFPFVFNSCSKDENNDNSISLNETGKALKYGDTYQISASSTNKITYTSENEYHATVSESGLITAGRIGETNILLSNGNDTKKLKVTINPESNLYPEPNIEFGISKSELIKKLGTPSYQTSDGIRYDNYSTSAPNALYLFDSNNKLTTSSVMVKTAYSSELGTYLGERYVYTTSSEEDYTLIFVNNLKPENITMLIGASLYNTSYWMTIYLPYTPQKSSPENKEAIQKSINELMK